MVKTQNKKQKFPFRACMAGIFERLGGHFFARGATGVRTPGFEKLIGQPV